MPEPAREGEAGEGAKDWKGAWDGNQTHDGENPIHIHRSGVRSISGGQCINEFTGANELRQHKRELGFCYRGFQKGLIVGIVCNSKTCKGKWEIITAGLI